MSSTIPVYINQDGGKVAKLIDFLENPVSSDPGSPVDGLKWYNTTSKRFKYFDGTATKTIANLEDIGSIGTFQGGHDATTGVPTGASIEAGDFWRVTVGGTITGIQGADVVEVNDLIYALVDGATNAADFLAVEVNQDFSAFVKEDSQSLASLPANTATDVNPVGLSSISSYMITTSAGVNITQFLGVVVDQATPKITITSLLPLTNLNIKFAGT